MFEMSPSDRGVCRQGQGPGILRVGSACGLLLWSLLKMSPSHRCAYRSPPRCRPVIAVRIGVRLGPRCRPVIAVPIGASGQRMFRVDRIYAILLWSVVAMSPSHRCAYKGL